MHARRSIRWLVLVGGVGRVTGTALVEAQMSAAIGSRDGLGNHPDRDDQHVQNLSQPKSLHLRWPQYGVRNFGQMTSSLASNLFCQSARV